MIAQVQLGGGNFLQSARPGTFGFHFALSKFDENATMRSLENIEYEHVWAAFYDKFKFKPSVNGPFPAIVEPSQSVAFRLRDQHTDDELDELREAIFHAFSVAEMQVDEVYYLDWQHECFGIKIGSMSSRVNGYPDGDYAILVEKSMRSGTFGHPWEGSICFLGDVFVREILKRRPSILGDVIRNNGGYVL